MAAGRSPVARAFLQSRIANSPNYAGADWMGRRNDRQAVSDHHSARDLPYTVMYGEGRGG
jgi:hypothetical protein